MHYQIIQMVKKNGKEDENLALRAFLLKTIGTSKTGRTDDIQPNPKCHKDPIVSEIHSIAI